VVRQVDDNLENWKILLEQSFTAYMPLLIAVAVYCSDYGEDARVNGVACTISVTPHLCTF